ncbi:MAG: 23S rRNA (adenine(2030)-N(6))-methyltransferase RlmJ [Cellvibrionaceae bacterium]
MLSYRHSFHAGNFADLLKHIVLVEILTALRKKEKGFDYIDTHSGAGLFNLCSEDAKKLNEHTEGIGQLRPEDWPELSEYFDAIDAVNESSTLNYYPGSPIISAHFLRKQDTAWLFELHPQDFGFLEKNVVSFYRNKKQSADKRQVKIKNEDGYKNLVGLLPPKSRRGFILIDPSYEIKAEYDQVFNTIEAAYKKFTTGVYALWYPVVDREKINALEKKFKKSGIKNIQRFELGISPDTDERGMTASGMIVINPPWGLFEKMSVLLPKLAKLIGEGDNKMFKSEILVSE